MCVMMTAMQTIDGGQKDALPKRANIKFFFHDIKVQPLMGGWVCGWGMSKLFEALLQQPKFFLYDQFLSNYFYDLLFNRAIASSKMEFREIKY